MAQKKGAPQPPRAQRTKTNVKKGVKGFQPTPKKKVTPPTARGGIPQRIPTPVPTRSVPQVGTVNIPIPRPSTQGQTPASATRRVRKRVITLRETRKRREGLQSLLKLMHTAKSGDPATRRAVEDALSSVVRDRKIPVTVDWRH